MPAEWCLTALPALDVIPPVAVPPRVVSHETLTVLIGDHMIAADGGTSTGGQKDSPGNTNERGDVTLHTKLPPRQPTVDDINLECHRTLLQLERLES